MFTESGYPQRPMLMRFGGKGSGSSSSSQPTSTVVQSAQIPAYEQQFSQANQDLANSLASQPFPGYQGRLVAPMTDIQNRALTAVDQSANNWQPALNQENNSLGSAANSINYGFNPLQAAVNPLNAAFNPLNAAFNPLDTAVNHANPAATQAWNQPGVAQSYINPYVQASLQPQLSLMNQQLQQQNNATGLQAAGDNAFGDARTGIQEGLNQQNTDLAQAQLIGQGYNTAYSQGMQGQQANMAGAQNEQAVLGNLAGQYGSLGGQFGNLGGQFGNIAGQYGNLGGQLANVGSQYGNMGQMQQQLALQGAGAMYNAGSQQQQLKQQQYNTAYQQFQNQTNWPYQMLNLRESALSNSPYTVANAMTVPNPSPLTTGLGAFATLAGGAGGLSNAFGNSSGQWAGSPQPYRGGGTVG